MRVSTGRRVLTSRNQLLNILRNTVACYAGAVADADAITTTPFDAPTGLPTEASRRNARNTQHILAQECHLAQVSDPAGGSWYIEWYTREVAKSAWSLLQQIEAQGGMIKAAASGWVAEQIKPTQAARKKDIAVRKVVVTGVSEHPSLTRGAPRPGSAGLSAARRRRRPQRLPDWRPSMHDPPRSTRWRRAGTRQPPRLPPRRPAPRSARSRKRWPRRGASRS